MQNLIKIDDPADYKVYLNAQLSNIIKDPKILRFVVHDMYQVFLDGVKLGRGDLKVEA